MTSTHRTRADRPAPTFFLPLLLVLALVAGTVTVSCAAETGTDEAPAAGSSGAGETAEATGDPDEVLARVGDDAITRAEVEEAAGEELGQIDQQLVQARMEARQGRHQAIEQRTRQMVRERLIAAEAEARGMSEDQLLQTEVQSRAAEITDADVDTFYEENRNRIPNPKEQVAGQIRQYLQQQRESEAYEDFISGLEEKAGVEYQIGPYRAEVSVADEPSTGPADAPVTIVEFSDFECPYCSRVVPTLDRVKEEYGDRVNVVFKQFPLAIHANAQKAGEASLCAHDQGKFWEMHDAMFADQQNLGPEGLAAKAESLGLDMEAFRQCMNSEKYAEAVREDMREGSSVGVSGTPAMFVNGRLISGAVPYEQIAAVIDEELGR